jgi:pimeloyl-ACP methyl ester carboxylesterase
MCFYLHRKSLVFLASFLAAVLLLCTAALAKTYKIKTSKDVYAAGETIEVNFSGAPGFWRDWICLVPKGAPADNPGDYNYTGSGVHQGKVVFNGKEPGDYEARAYFDYGSLGYVISARYFFKVAPGKVPVDEDESQPELVTGLADESRVSRSKAFMYFLKTLAVQSVSPRRDPELDSAEIQNFKFSAEGYHLGEVTNLDADRFDEYSGRKGLERPVQFLSEEGLGIFFLEPYSPQKIPVLFIHGAGGYPQEWKYLIDKMDKNKYQAWFFQYSSGMRLDWTAQMLEMGLKSLWVNYNFQKLYIVAHSMGGLVAQRFLDMYQDDYVKLLVTISTPWGGHNAAKTGVTRAREVVPSWYDMVPESPFLHSLFKDTDKQQPPHFLLFGYKGKYGIFADGNSDGSVTLESMLDPKAQKAAVKVLGFNADHTGILAAPEVADTMNGILGSVQYILNSSRND